MRTADIEYAIELRKQYTQDKAEHEDLLESFKATEAMLKGNAPLADDLLDAYSYYTELAEELNTLGARINETASLYNEIVGAA